MAGVGEGQDMAMEAQGNRKASLACMQCVRAKASGGDSMH